MDDTYVYKELIFKKELTILHYIRNNFIPIEQKKFISLKEPFVVNINDKEYMKTLKIKGIQYDRYIDFTVDQLKQIIIIICTLAKYGIYEKDSNPKNYMVHEGNIIKIDFGGINNFHLVSCSGNLVDNDPILMKHLGLSTPLVQLFDTDIYGISEKICKKIFGEMFLQFKNRIEYELIIYDTDKYDEINNLINDVYNCFSKF
jgi:hypothetical protein